MKILILPLAAFTLLSLGMLACKSGESSELSLAEGTYLLESEEQARTGELQISLLPGGKITYSLTIVGAAPAYNQGFLQGESTLKDGKAMLGTSEFGGPCKIELVALDSATLKLTTREGDPATCGFGNGVVPDGTYRLGNQATGDAAAETIDPAQLTGLWRSTDDPTYELAIDEANYKEYNRGEEVSAQHYKFFEKCPSGCGDMDLANCLQTWSDQDTFCFVVLQADLQFLELSLIGGTGQSIRFERMK
ncbi:MAG: hypothetical protein CMN32_12095 [Saprospirales bacterium]|nr:hypothetical protein [Saprospirales bacterium]